MSDSSVSDQTAAEDSLAPALELARFTHKEVVLALLAGRTLQLADGGLFTIGEEARKVLHFYSAPDRRALWEKGAKNGSETETKALLRVLEQPLPPVTAPAAAGAGAVATWNLIQVDVGQFGGLQCHCTANGSAPLPVTLTLDQLITLLRGQNSAGKSQLTRALCWGLTGQIPRAQAEPAPAESLTTLYAPATKGAKGFALPTIVPFPDQRDLDRRDGEPLLATTVEMTFEMASLRERRRVRRSLAAERKGFSSVVQVIADDGTVERSVPSVAAALGVSELAVDMAALSMARVPVLPLDAPNALSRGVAVLTGLQPLATLGARLKGTVRKWVTELPKALQKRQQDELAKQFGAKVELIAQQFRLGEPIPEALLPPLPLASDGGAACAAALKALGEELGRRDVAMREAVKASTGLDLATADKATLKTLKTKIAAAEQALQPDRLSSRPEWTALDLLLAVSDKDLGKAARVVEDALTQARTFARLDTDRRAAARRRLYATIHQWHKVGQPEETWPPEQCPVCETALDGKVDAALDVPLRTALEVAAEDEAALSLDANTWNLKAEQALLERLPPTLRAAHVAADGKGAAPRLFRTSCTTAAAAAGALSGTLAPLAVGLEQEFTRLADGLPEAVGAQVPDLPNAARGGAFEATLTALAGTLASVRWCRQAAEAVTRIRSALFGDSPSGEDCAFGGFIGGRLGAVEQALVSLDPLEAAKDALQALETVKKDWDECLVLISLASRAGPALQELGRLEEVVSSQVDALLKDLDHRTRTWTERFYTAPSETAPKLQGTRIEDGIMRLPAERDGVTADGRELLNGSRLRTHLFAFALALAERVRTRDGGLSLMVLDDPQTLFDERNQRQLAKGLGMLPGEGFRPVIVTFDHHFAASLYRQVPKADDVTYLELHPRSTNQERVRIERHREQVDRRRDEWHDDDHNQALIAAFCLEARRTLESSFRDLLWPSGQAVTGDEALRVLHEAVRALTKRNGVYAEKCFKTLVDHPAWSVEDFRTVMNWSAHFPAENLVTSHARLVETHLDPLLKAVEACQTRLDQAMTQGAKIAGAIILPFPASPVPATALPEIGRAAAQRGIMVDGDTAVEMEDVVRLDPERHRLLAVGKGLHWLPGVLTPGDVVVADMERPTLEGLVVVWDGSRQTTTIGWAQPGRGGERGLVLHGAPHSGFARIFDPARCTVMAVAGILIGLAPPPKQPLTIWEHDQPFSGMDGSVAVEGRSAAPFLLPGDHVLTGPAVTEIRPGSGLSGRPVVARLDDGTQVIKRIGPAIDSAGKVRLLESLGAQGDTIPVRLSETADDAFTRFVRVVEVRPILGFWFVSARPSGQAADRVVFVD